MFMRAGAVGNLNAIFSSQREDGTSRIVASIEERLHWLAAFSAVCVCVCVCRSRPCARLRLLCVI